MDRSSTFTQLHGLGRPTGTTITTTLQPNIAQESTSSDFDDEDLGGDGDLPPLGEKDIQ